MDHSQSIPERCRARARPLMTWTDLRGLPAVHRACRGFRIPLRPPRTSDPENHAVSALCEEARHPEAPGGSPELPSVTNAPPSHQRACTRPAILWYQLRRIHNDATNVLEHLGSHRGARRAPTRPRCPREKMPIFSACLTFLMLELRESSL